MNFSNIASLVVTAFLGGATTYLSSTQLPSAPEAWKPFAIGAAIAGLAAVAHLYQTSPSDKEGK